MMYIPTVKDDQYYGVLYDVLFSQRQVFITQEITKEYSALLVAQIMYLDNVNSEPITINISSNGGDIDGMFMLLDCFKVIESPIHTINLGAAYSCAALLLMAGDKRYAFPSSRILLHQPLAGFSGYMQTSDVEIKAKEMIFIKNKIRDFIVEHSNMDAKTVEQAMDRDTYYTAQEALELGMIDKIL